MMGKLQQQGQQTEADCARATYDDLMRRVAKFQASRKPDEMVVLKANDITVDAVGVRGATIWFQGKNTSRVAVWIVQHYSQVNVRLTAARLTKGETPKRIGFLTD
jgi:hypothetical protein